jgi:hypothetical protein
MRIVCALSSGSAAAVACGIVLSAVFGGLGSWIAWVVLAAGGLAAWGALRSVESDPLPRPGFWDYLVLGVFTWAAFRAFFWLYYPDGGVLKVLSPHNLGDLSLHLGLIRYFAGGIAFWPPNLLLVGAPLTYPPGADFFNALLVSAGWDVRGSLVAVGFVWALAAGWALWRYGGAFCVAAFLFGGGLAGFAIFRTGEFLEYGSGGTWKNAFLTMLVTQRGFLFALPAGLALLWSWRKDFAPDASSPRIPLLFQVLLYATLPLFQVHAFVFLSAVLAFAVPANPRGWRAPVRLAAWAFVPAAACMAVVTDRFTAGGALRWDPFWTLEPGGLSGFLLEFGVAVFLAVWLLAALVKSGDRAGLWMAGVPALVAVLAFLVPVTDWAWDNTKFLIWAWVAAAPVLWAHVVRPLPLAARAMICALLFFSGAVALAAGLDTRHGYELAKRSELADWQVLTKDLPRDAVLAIHPDYNHPALLLGFRAVCGYEGHLSSHGLDYQKTLEDLHRILAQEPGWRDLARSLGVNAIALRSDENPSGKPLLEFIGNPAESP